MKTEQSKKNYLLKEIILGVHPTPSQASPFSVNSSCIPAFRPLLSGVEAGCCGKRAGTPRTLSLVWMSVHGKSGNVTGRSGAPKAETAGPRPPSRFCQAFALWLAVCHSLFLLSERCEMAGDYRGDTRSNYSMLGKIFCFPKSKFYKNTK